MRDATRIVKPVANRSQPRRTEDVLLDLSQLAADQASDSTIKTSLASRKPNRFWPVSILVILFLVLSAIYFAFFSNEGQSSNITLPNPTRASDTEIQIPFSGTLVARNSFWVVANEDAVVKSIHVQSGNQVEPDALLLELTNPVLEFELELAEINVAEATANLAESIHEHESNLRRLESEVQIANGEYEALAKEAKAMRSLQESGVVSELELIRHESTLQAMEIRARLRAAELDNEVNRGEVSFAPEQQRLHAEKRREKAFRNRILSLRVLAEGRGTIEAIEAELEPGASVKSGQRMIHISDFSSFDAVINIPSEAVPNVYIGMPIKIQIANNLVDGQVASIAGKSINQQVQLKVSLSGPMPSTVRPNLIVTGELNIIQN